jgi:hypothetical protein
MLVRAKKFARAITVKAVSVSAPAAYHRPDVTLWWKLRAIPRTATGAKTRRTRPASGPARRLDAAG